MNILTYNKQTGEIANVKSTNSSALLIPDEGYDMIVLDHIDTNIHLYRVDTATKELVLKPNAAEMINAQKWSKILEIRNALLAGSDWTELPSNMARKDAAWAVAWQIYRQALRDITKQNDPDNIVWPNRPKN